MEDLRMNRLFEHVEKMDKSLVSMLQSYKNFSERKKPTICVLCSDNRLKAEVDKTFSIRDDLCIDIIVTSDEIIDKQKALLCDALVVCTRAKNIAPKGLYDLMKSISSLDKHVFVVLAGWESVERSEKMAQLRAERVSVEFNFARIMEVTNVFSTPCEGFDTWDGAFDSFALQILKQFEMWHLDQDEKVYNYLLKFVEDFYAKSRTEINKEIAVLNNKEKIAVAKQDYYQVRFSNLTICVQDVVDSVRSSIEDISYYDIVDDIKKETLTDKYTRSGVEAQKYAKQFLTQEYRKRVDKLKDNNNEKVRIDSESCVMECVNEMSTLADEISKLNYLPSNFVDRLREVCDEKTELRKIVNRYIVSEKILLDNIFDRIPAKVGEYRYEMKYSVEVRDTGKDLLGMTKNVIKDLLSEEKENSSEIRNDIEDKSTKSKRYHNKTKNTDDYNDEEIRKKLEKNIYQEENVTLMFDRFQKDIEQLIYHSRYACGEMAQDCARVLKQDMKKYVDSILKIYFGTIIKEIESMQIEMDKILDEYYLE